MNVMVKINRKMKSGGGGGNAAGNCRKPARNSMQFARSRADLARGAVDSCSFPHFSALDFLKRDAFNVHSRGDEGKPGGLPCLATMEQTGRGLSKAGLKGSDGKFR